MAWTRKQRRKYKATIETRKAMQEVERALVNKPDTIEMSANMYNQYRQFVGDDPINPQHYTSHPSGVECITVTEWFNFNLGNAIKYIWRAREKGDELSDLKKAQWYIEREIERITNVGKSD